MAYGSVTVTDSATVLVAANCARQELLLSNISTGDDIYLGMDSAVTTSNGIPLYAGQDRERSRGFGTYLGPIYAIAKIGKSVDVRFWETTR
jgi:hypothetical protein